MSWPHSSVFKDESKLDINYVPHQLPHREHQLRYMNQLFRFTIEHPGKMAQRILITGKIGVGKTVLSQRFGLNLLKEAQEKRVNLRYVHVNCRECKGSFFLILQRVILTFNPNFPRRGYSAEEQLQILMQLLDEQDAHLILAMDELDALIKASGSDSLYNLTRVQEDRLEAPQRLSLICIIREPGSLDALDFSTRSTLQTNIIQLEDYLTSQLRDILNHRVHIAFRSGTISDEVIDFIAESVTFATGDARYAIELLWRAGKVADTFRSREVLPEHVRRATVNIYPVLRRETISSLNLHEKLLLLGVARHFQRTPTSYVSMGEVEEAYEVVCEEHHKKKLGHTQLWKYLKELSTLGIIKTEISSVGFRGKTTLISLPTVPATDLERELNKTLHRKQR